MKKSFVKKCILWFFGHIVFSTGFVWITSDESRFEILSGFVDPTTPTFKTAETIMTAVGGVAVVAGILMIIPFWIEIFKRLPFIANKTVKGAGKVLKKIGNNATTSVDRMHEEEGLEKLQRVHGLIKDKKEENKSSSSRNDDEYEYYVDDVSKSQIEREMNCVCKYAMDSNFAKVTLDRYSISQNGDGSYDIDVYFEVKLYVQYADELDSCQAAIEKLANRIINNIAERVGALGCGFRIIPHMGD